MKIFSIILICILVASAEAGGCPAASLSRGEFLTESCQKFLMIHINKTRIILKKERNKYVAYEIINCKASILDKDGTYKFHSKLTSLNFYCTKEERN